MATVVRFLDGRIMFRIVQVIAIVSLLIGLSASVQVYSLTNCLADYNDRDAAASRARAATFERGTEAEDDMWLAFADAQKMPPDEARRVSTEAFNRYVAERRAAREERLKHPLPAPPSKVCR